MNSSETKLVGFEHSGKISEEELKSVLIPNKIIGVKHKKIYSPMVTVIKSYEKDFITLKLSKSFLENSILEGENLILNIFVEQFEYIIFGNVEEYKREFPSSVVIKIFSVSKFANMRKSKRYHTSFNSFIYLNKDDVSSQNHSIIKNISLTGLCLVCKEEIPRGSTVYVKFSTDTKNTETIEFEAKVVRVNPAVGYAEYGLDVLNIDDANKSRYEKLLESLEKDERKILDI